MQKHSDFIIYVDESGDHSLESIDQEYPIFVLSFCVFRKEEYISQTTTAVRRLKFETFGHDMVVLHESDIRRKSGAFAKLGKDTREAFMESLNTIIAESHFELVAVVIDKLKLKSKYSSPGHPYHLALQFGLERIYRFLCQQKQQDAVTWLVCEARGKKEDNELELAFRRIRDGANYFNRQLPFELIFAEKRCNSEGLQLADLTARPIGLKQLRPKQENRALEVLEPKYLRNAQGKYRGVGLKVFP